MYNNVIKVDLLSKKSKQYLKEERFVYVSKQKYQPHPSE